MAVCAALNRSSQPNLIDPSLYLVINPEQCLHHAPRELAERAVKGGVSAVQIRKKTGSNQDYQSIAVEIRNALATSGIPVFVNDRVEVAAAASIDCIHLGQDDVSINSARRLLGENVRIGLTVRSVDEAARAPLAELSYVSVGGVFATRSKFNPDPPIGLRTLATIVRQLRLRNSQCPIIAISGISLKNVDSVLATGVDGIAVVAAICEAKDPESIAQAFRNKINKYI